MNVTAAIAGHPLYGFLRSKLFPWWRAGLWIVTRPTLLVVALGLMVALGASMKWIVPLAEEAKSETYRYVPIRFAPNMEGDDYWYYTYIRDVIDWSLLPSDPVAYEHQDNGLSIHNGYTASFWACALGGWSRGSTWDAYYVNHFLWPFLGFWFLYLLLYKLTESRAYAALFALFSILWPYYYMNPGWAINTFYSASLGDWQSLTKYGYAPIGRTPNILFTNVHLSAFVYFLYRFVEQPRPGAGVTGGLLAMLALAPLVIPQNFVMTYAIFGLALLVYAGDPPLRKRMLWMALAAALLAAPGVRFMLVGTENHFNGDYVIYGWGGPTYKTDVRMENFLAGVRLFVAPLLFLLAVRGRQGRFALTVVAALFIAFILLSVTKGSYPAGKITDRGAGILLSGLMAVGFYPLLGWWKEAGMGARFRPALLGAFMAVALAAGALSGEYALAKKSVDTYNDPSFHALARWAEGYFSKNDVLMTLDADVNLNLPIYSATNVYVAPILESAAGNVEVRRRFHEALWFHGLTPEEYRRQILDEMRGYGNLSKLKDPNEIQASLDGMILTFSVHAGRPLAETEKMLWSFYYERALPAIGRRGLSFKANYLLVSTYSRNLMKEGSGAWKAIEGAEPLFANDRYAVYRLPEKG
ncbi:MAG: hypothetical protein HQK87_05245 [Nitrospinae bacterium]|nr:hypothetical protein [Nitrospinota bacterium]